MQPVGPGALRVLAVVGALLVAAGWAVGWFERAAPELGAPVTVVHPDGLALAGPLAWVLALPVLVVPFLPRSPRVLLVGWLALLPALAGTAVAGAVTPRTATAGETLRDVVEERPLGQGLALLGLLLSLMATVTAWRGAPDWRVPERWTGEDE